MTCTKCGKPRNFDVDGITQEHCYECYDHLADWSKEQLAAQLRMAYVAAWRYATGRATVNATISLSMMAVPNFLKDPRMGDPTPATLRRAE